MKQCTCGRSKIYPYCDGTHNDRPIDKDKVSDTDSLKNKEKD